MKLPKILLIIMLSLFLSGCGGELTEIEIEEIRSKEIVYEAGDIRAICENAGGYYETWQDGATFCMFDGWGCDPLLFAKGLCGKEF